MRPRVVVAKPATSRRCLRLGARDLGEAQKRLDYERGQTETAAEEIEYAPPRVAETEDAPRISADENYAGFVRLGDDDLDALLADRLQTPELQNGMLGGIRMEGAAGDAKVPDEGNIRTLIGTMAGRIENKLPEAEREAISLEQTRAAADIIGLDPKKLEVRLREGFNIDPGNPGALAAHVVAAKDLLVSEVKKLDELTGAAAGDEYEVGLYDARELVATLSASSVSASPRGYS